MKVWEARKADGLDYDPDDERRGREGFSVAERRCEHLRRSYQCLHYSMLRMLYFVISDKPTATAR